MKTSFYSLFFIGILNVLFINGCASGSMKMVQSEASISDGMLASRTTGGAGEAGTTTVPRMLIKRASIELIVEDIDQSAQTITQWVQELGGYVNSSNTSEEKNAWMQVRVPANQLEPTMNKCASLGEEQYRNISATDVTDQMIDLEAKLTNDRALRDRMRKLLEQAKEIKDILAIEAELNRLQSGIDSLEGQLKRLQSEVQLSILDVKLTRSRIYGPLGYLSLGVVWFFEKLFVIQD